MGFVQWFTESNLLREEDGCNLQAGDEEDSDRRRVNSTNNFSQKNTKRMLLFRACESVTHLDP